MESLKTKPSRRFSVTLLTLVGLFMVLFLAGNVSAYEFDNSLRYEDLDMKVTLENIWGLGSDLGSVELKSHKSVVEVVGVGLGKQVPMFYDFDFNEIYEKGLGEVSFTSEITGKLVDKDWSFVYWGNKTLERDVCIKEELVQLLNKSSMSRCLEYGKENYQVEGWLPYLSKDIPKGKIRIGIEVFCLEGERLDGVWEIGGQRISKHSSWSASLDVGIRSYYKLNNIAVAIDEFDVLNGTVDGATNASGLLGSAYSFDGTNDVVALGDADILSVEDMTLSFWIKDVADTDNEDFFSEGVVGASPYYAIQYLNNHTRLFLRDATGTLINVEGSEIIGTPGWHHIVFTKDALLWVLYVDNVADETASMPRDPSASSTTSSYFGGGYSGGLYNWIDTDMDEIGVWDRTLSPTEVTQLYNGGAGITYTVASDNVPNITLNSPSSTNYTTSPQNLEINFTAWDDIKLENVTLWVNGVLNQTNSSGLNNSIYLFDLTLGDGDYTIYGTATDNDSQSTNSSSIIIGIDSVLPSIVINVGNGTFNYSEDGLNNTINITATDTNLDTCWADYNSTNTTFTCATGTISSVNLTLFQNNNTVRFYANDTFGNVNHTDVTWNYKLYEISESYVSSTIEGAINVFNITFNSTAQITTAYLNYNGTSALGSISSSGETYTLSKNQEALTVDALTNLSFFWEITRSDAFVYNTTSQNQSVSSVAINSTCTGMTYLINMTLLDEGTQTQINGTLENSLIKVDLDLYTSDGDTKLIDFSQEFSKTNPIAICISENLSTGATYLMDIQIQYSTDNHSFEFYNIESFALSESTLGKNYNLYDLDTDDTQKFRILARDTAYLPVSNGLIQIERKYLENGTFYVTEIPKTDEAGITSASLEVDDVIYNFYVYLDGVLQYSITNVLAICQTPTIIECEIDLNDFLTGIDVPDFEEGDDFNFTLSYNETSKIISSAFAIPSGDPSTVQLVVTSQDTLGTSVCTDTLASASGTLQCTIPNTFGNSSVIAKLYKDSVEQGKGTVKLDQSSSDIYGTSLILISLMAMMTLIGLAITGNPVISAAFIFVGVILMFGINLIQNTGYYGATATILYLGIAIILIIVKAGRRN